MRVDQVLSLRFCRAKDKSQQQLLLHSFYQYTTLSHKAAYEWADPQVRASNRSLAHSHC